MTKALTPLALALAGVTAGSVGMAVHGLIADPLLAWMFSGAAVALDIFKYAAWPAAAALAASGRKFLAAGLVSCAVVFAGVSGWATYDRFVGAVEGRSIGNEIRLADLEKVQEVEKLRLEALDAQIADIRRQADSLRLRGVITKAQELEAFSLTRADSERAKAVARIEAASKERQQITSKKGSTLPSAVTSLIGLGFALALEVVPVLIFLIGGKPARREEDSGQLPAVVTQVQEPVFMGNCTDNPTEEHAAVSEEPTREPSKPVGQSKGKDEELMKALLASGGELLKVKDFAKANGIGNTRASAIYKAAEAAGHIRKTAAGYVTA